MSGSVRGKVVCADTENGNSTMRTARVDTNSRLKVPDDIGPRPLEPAVGMTNAAFAEHEAYGGF